MSFINVEEKSKLINETISCNRRKTKLLNGVLTTLVFANLVSCLRTQGGNNMHISLKHTIYKLTAFFGRLTPRCVRITSLCSNISLLIKNCHPQMRSRVNNSALHFSFLTQLNCFNVLLWSIGRRKCNTLIIANLNALLVVASIKLTRTIFGVNNRNL